MAIIAGCVGHGLQRQNDALERMLGALPNSAGFQTRRLMSDEASFLWRGVTELGGLLEIADVPSGRSVTVCLDGVIANLDELAQELGCLGIPAATVLVTAYARWGIEFVARLVGSFAIAIHDPQRKSLHLVRDTIGTMPLYWGQRAEAVAFASLPAAVCVGIGQRVSLSEKSIRRELLGLDTIAPDSVFEGVKAVEPGTVLSVIGGAIRSLRYRRLVDSQVRGISDEQLIAMMREGITEGVRWYLARPESSVAVAFSGGMDSSAVLGAACQDPIQRERVFAVTAVATGPAETDREYAESVVKKCGARWECFRSQAPTVPDALLRYASNPVRVADLGFSWEVFCKAHERGCNTVLTGALGDVIGGVGWGWQLSMLWNGLFRSLLRELGEDGLHGVRLSRAVLGVALRLAWYRLGVGRFVRPKQPNRISLSLDLIGATGTERTELEQECWALGHRFAVSPPEYADWLSWAARQYFPSELEAFGLLGRVRGLEVGSPLSHPKVLSAGLSLSWSLRRRGGLTRVALREAARPWLPDEVLRRRQKLTFDEHVLPMWQSVIREARQTEGMRRTADFIDLDTWNALCTREGSLSADMVCILYEATILERWLALNAAGATGN